MASVDGGNRFALSSRSRLTARDLPRFREGTLLHRVARVVAAADCLPRKELFEAWEVARRVRRRFRGGRVVDLACGHAVLAHLMLILDDTSPTALAVDRRIPPSARKLADAFAAEWPRLAGRVSVIETELDAVPLDPADVVVSAHACGPLTDIVLDRAVAAGARVAVLPCCHSKARSDSGGLDGWLDSALAIDVTRAARLGEKGYAIVAQRIPESITPKNRLLMGAPRK